LKLKGKLLAGASALAMAGGLIGVAAPAAHAVITNAGGCSSTVSLVKLTSPTKGQGLGDQTTQIKVVGNIAKDVTAPLVVPSSNSGSCSGVIRTCDTHVPNGPHAGLQPISAAISLLGNASCANGPGAMAVDATSANAYALNGSITYKFFQTYVDLTTALTKNYAAKAQVALLGIGQNGNGPDVVDIGGIVLTGMSAGATVSGSIWEDPVAKGGKFRTVTDAGRTSASTTITSATAKFAATDVGGTITGTGIPAGTTIASINSLTSAEMSAAATSTGTGGTAQLNADAFNSNYQLDLGNALGCADATAGNANILQVLSSGGGANATSMLGSATTGISFDFGEA